MELYESISVVVFFLDITYTQNPGAAFSMLSEAPPWVREALLMLLASGRDVVLAGVDCFRAERVSSSSIAFALILVARRESDRSGDTAAGLSIFVRSLLRSELSGPSTSLTAQSRSESR